MTPSGQLAVVREPTAAELRLVELEEKLTARAEAREKRNELTVDEKIAIAERRLAVDEALERFEAEHGRLGKAIDIVRVDDETDGRAIILKRPNMSVYRRYQDLGKTKTEDVEKLVRPCLLYPPKAEFDALMAELPFIITLCANTVATLAGVRREDVEGK